MVITHLYWSTYAKLSCQVYHLKTAGKHRFYTSRGFGGYLKGLKQGIVERVNAEPFLLDSNKELEVDRNGFD
jgi:hypothetical protein